MVELLAVRCRSPRSHNGNPGSLILAPDLHKRKLQLGSKVAQKKGGHSPRSDSWGTVLLAIPPPARSQQARAIIEPPLSDPRQNAATVDVLPVLDANSAPANDSLGGAEQETAAQEPDTPQAGIPTPCSTDSQKARLAVNPFTGLTVSPALNFTPLTVDERWKLYWKQNFLSIGAYFRPIFFALILDQTTNSPSQWGGGFAGFGPRVGSRVLSNIVQGTIRTPLAAVLHEDVRYITDHRGGKRGLLHAVEYSFLTYNDQGHPTLNVAKLVGYYASTAISTGWRPGHHPLASYTFTNGSGNCPRFS